MSYCFIRALAPTRNQLTCFHSGSQKMEPRYRYQPDPGFGLLGEKNMETRETLLNQLDETISQFLDVYKNMANPEFAVYEEWTAKDILGHIVFWHESFARNIHDIVNGIKPAPLQGTYRDINQRCFNEMRTKTVEDLTYKLEAAHTVIRENILNPKLVKIPYKKGSRDYTPDEHLDIVNAHIKEHLKGVRKAITASKSVLRTISR